MKSSRYNISFEHRGRSYIYNAFTNAFASIPAEAIRFIERIDRDPTANGVSRDACAPLLRGGFLVDDGVDELTRLKVRNRMGRFSGRSLGLTIAPTLACNFRCTYCFEELNQEVMSEETQEAVYGFVVNSLKNADRFGVCWYGGEPLLALKTIEKLSRRFIDLARLTGISYDADIISNGYLMTPDVARTLAEYCKVGFWQVTLDGPAEIHDQRRRQRRGGPTFETILDNLAASHHLFDRVAIRVNIDKLNVDHVPRLLDRLEERGLKNKVSVYLGHVQNLGAACPSFAPTCFNVEEFANSEIDVYRVFADRGFAVSLRNHLRTAVCMADQKGTYLVDQRGNLTKCWNLIGDEREKIGTVFDAELNNRYFDWLGFDPFDDEECRACEILPICMGGCPYETVVAGKKECSALRYNLIRRMRLRLDIEARAAANGGDEAPGDPSSVCHCHGRDPDPSCAKQCVARVPSCSAKACVKYDPNTPACPGLCDCATKHASGRLREMSAHDQGEQP